MRFTKISIILVIFILNYGCQKKHPVPENLQFMVDEYEWSYSDDWDFHTADNSSTSYGIRIDQEGYLYTFKNGEELTKYKIDQYNEDNSFSTYQKHKTILKGRVKTFEKGSKELTVSSFPNPTSGSTNHFFTHE